jgi:hypothetical protein
MSRAQDSQFGSAEFVRLYMGALLVDNRGAIGAQVPIESVSIDKWSEYGMEIESIPGQKSTKQEEMVILRMTTENFRENQGLWMIDGLNCVPTGNSEYPYWIAKYSASENKTYWVLIHRDFGFQVTAEAGGANERYAGFGQSGTWRFSPYCVKFMAIDRQDWEHLVNQPARGVIWVSGLDHPTQFQEQVESYQEEREEQEMFFYPGVLFGGSRGENSKITMIPWSEPPAGYTADGWRKEWVDALAAAFHLNVTHLEVRLGEGAMTQSDIASSIEAETAVAAMRQHIEMVWNYLAPPRVLVQVVWQTDRTKRFQVETFRELSLAISRVQENKSGGGVDQQFPSGGEQTFTRDEIRALVESYIGIEIPSMSEDDTVEPDTKSGDDVQELWVPAFGGKPLSSIASDSGPEAAYRVGNVVSLNSGKHAVVFDWSGNNDWVWILTVDGYKMLVDARNLRLMNRIVVVPGQSIPWLELEDDEPWTHSLMVGGRATTRNGTPCTVSYIYGEFAYVRFDWDKPYNDPRPVPVNTLTPMGFEPEGEPLEPVLVVDLDPEEAEAEARESWDKYVPDGEDPEIDL